MEYYSFVFFCRVGIADINYGGHVSNAAVLTFFQDARIAFLSQIGPFSELDVGGCGLIMPEAHVFFRQEMFHGDNLQIGVRVAAIKKSSFTLEYRIESRLLVTAEGNTPLVCFDYQKGKACRMPAGFRSALERSHDSSTI